MCHTAAICLQWGANSLTLLHLVSWGLSAMWWGVLIFRVTNLARKIIPLPEVLTVVKICTVVFWVTTAHILVNKQKCFWVALVVLSPHCEVSQPQFVSCQRALLLEYTYIPNLNYCMSLSLSFVVSKKYKLHTTQTECFYSR